MRTLLLFLSLIILTGCKDTPSVNTPPETPLEDHIAADFANFLAPLIDPSKLDTLKGKRAAHTAITQGLLLAPDGSYKRL
jgi:hypothetical protein